MRRPPRVLAAVALLALLPACKRSDEARAPGGPVPLKLALDWVADPEFGGFYAAREAGLFQAAGLDVTLQGGGAGVPVVQMVASGKADFGITGADAVLLARARGADVVPLYAVFQKSPHAIMVRKSRGATSMADVLSKGTLAIEPGLPYAVFLKKKFGFDKVRVVPYDGGVARFIAEEDYAQQSFACSEPLAARKQGRDKGIEPQVFLVADEGFNPYLGVVITRAAMWKEKPELVKKFVRAAREGWQRYLAGPGPANAVIAKLNPSMDAQTLAEVAEAQRPFVESEDTKAKGLGAMTKARWETLAGQLVELGIVEQAVAPELPAID